MEKGQVIDILENRRIEAIDWSYDIMLNIMSFHKEIDRFPVLNICVYL